MYFTKLSLSSLLLLVVYSLTNVNHVSSLKCYNCTSFNNEICSQYEECGANIPNYPGIANMEYKCGKFGFSARVQGQSAYGIHKTCVPALSCDNLNPLMQRILDTLKSQLEIAMKRGVIESLSIDTCKVCDGNYCNSSTNLRVGTWSILLSIMIFFFTKG